MLFNLQNLISQLNPSQVYLDSFSNLLIVDRVRILINDYIIHDRFGKCSRSQITIARILDVCRESVNRAYQILKEDPRYIVWRKKNPTGRHDAVCYVRFSNPNYAFLIAHVTRSLFKGNKKLNKEYLTIINLRQNEEIELKRKRISNFLRREDYRMKKFKGAIGIMKENLQRSNLRPILKLVPLAQKHKDLVQDVRYPELKDELMKAMRLLLARNPASVVSC